jgi:hypothetical protein
MFSRKVGLFLLAVVLACISGFFCIKGERLIANIFAAISGGIIGYLVNLITKKSPPTLKETFTAEMEMIKKENQELWEAYSKLPEDKKIHWTKKERTAYMNKICAKLMQHNKQ